jgi:integrase/recombinase XerC
VEDVDLEARTLSVVEKGDVERRLPITNEVLRAIDMYLFELPATSGPLLRSARNGYEPIQAASIGRLVADWMRAAGVKRRPYDGVSAHALRRTALTEVAVATGDPFVLAELAGWASISTASHYVQRASTERVRNALGQREAL